MKCDPFTSNTVIRIGKSRRAIPIFSLSQEWPHTVFNFLTLSVNLFELRIDVSPSGQGTISDSFSNHMFQRGV